MTLMWHSKDHFVRKNRIPPSWRCPSAFVFTMFGTGTEFDVYETNPNDDPVEEVWYSYAANKPWAGNPVMIVEKVYDVAMPSNPATYYAWKLDYNNTGEVWFITQSTW